MLGQASSFEVRLKPARLVHAVADTVTRLGISVRWEQGSFRGGLCSIEGEPVLILNKQQPAESQLAVLAGVLRRLPLDSIYIRPAVREDIKRLLEAV